MSGVRENGSIEGLAQLSTMQELENLKDDLFCQNYKQT